jgi:hypothetical protein
MMIDFGFCKLSLVHKNITYQFKRELTQVLNDQAFEHTIKKSETKTSEHWNQPYE